MKITNLKKRKDLIYPLSLFILGMIFNLYLSKYIFDLKLGYILIGYVIGDLADKLYVLKNERTE